MSRARDIANLVDANGDVVAGALDNVPAADLVNDTTPQLGGALDAQSYAITSVGNMTARTEGNGTTFDMRQGSAKAWLVYYNTGTASILDSHNISSVSDYATGQFNPTYSSNFTSANYAFGGAADNGSAGAINAALAQTQFSSAPSMSSSSTSLSNEDVDGPYTDYDRNTVAYHGDLA